MSGLPSVFRDSVKGPDVVLQGDSREGVDNGGERGEEVELPSVQERCRRA